MAGNSFMAFLEAVVSARAELQDALNATTSAEEFAQVSIRLGREHGHQFTVNDVHQVLALEVARLADSDELSDEQLDAVAGGMCAMTCNTNSSNLATQTIGCNYNLRLHWVVKA